MATGASNAQLAVILIDARKGVLVQTRRHTFICSLLGIRHVVVAVNKMDLVGFEQGDFRPNRRRLYRVRLQARIYARSCRFRSRPASATTSRRRPPTRRGIAARALLDYLETVEVDRGDRGEAVPLSGAMGQSAEPGFPRLCRNRRVRPDPVRRPGRRCCRPARPSRVNGIVTYDGPLRAAQSGDAVTHDARPKRSTSRAATCWSRPTARPEVSDQFAAHVIWMDRSPDAGPVLLAADRHQGRPASITAIKYRIDVNTREHLAAPHARPQRHRLLQSVDGVSGRVRSLRAKPQDRLIHHHRPLTPTAPSAPE